MTDKDPMDHSVTPEDGAAETWQEEHGAPEDDFRDPAADGAGDAAASGQQDAQQAKKKNTTMIVVGVLALATLGAGGFAVSQFLLPQQVAEAPVMQAATDGALSEPVDPAALVEAAVDPRVGQTDLAAALPADVAAASAMPQPTPPLPPVPQIDPMTGQVAVPPPAMPQPPVVADPAVQVPAANPAAAALEGRLGQLEGQMLSLQQALDRNAAELMAISSRLNTMPASGGASPELEQRVLQLQQQVEQMAAQRTAAAPEKSVAAATEEKPVRKKATASVPRKPAAPKTSSRWVLRAATPDSAWVSEGAAGSDLKRVAVGDTLSGIGRIREIRQSGGQWQLVGTQGVVR